MNHHTLARPTQVADRVSAPMFLRIRVVMRLTGLSRSTIYRMMAQHSFPQPVRLSRRLIAWRGSEMDQWSEGRPNASGHTAEFAQAFHDSQALFVSRAAAGIANRAKRRPHIPPPALALSERRWGTDSTRGGRDAARIRQRREVLAVRVLAIFPCSGQTAISLLSI